MIELKSGQLAQEYDIANHKLLSVYLILTSPKTSPAEDRFKALCIFESMRDGANELFNLPGDISTFMVSLFNPGDSYWKIDNVKLNPYEPRF